MQNIASKVVVLGTGGTIAGTSAQAGDNIGYSAAQLGVAQLLAAVPALAQTALECEQVAQLDSKDMGFDVWRQLALRVAHHVARADVAGVVITHGTDTMEETAYFLQRVLAPVKPVVLTGAMRPATALLRDGPQNVLDAVSVAGCAEARGVVVAFQGQVHAAHDVRKLHPYRLNAFDSGDAGPLAVVEEGAVRLLRPWPQGDALGIDRLPAKTAEWPAVEIVTSHAGASGRMVRAICSNPSLAVRGLVVAATGNGTVHHELEAALLEAQAEGVKVLRSSRCEQGRVLTTPADSLPSAGDLTPVKARIELMLQLM